MTNILNARCPSNLAVFICYLASMIMALLDLNDVMLYMASHPATILAIAMSNRFFVRFFTWSFDKDTPTLSLSTQNVNEHQSSSSGKLYHYNLRRHVSSSPFFVTVTTLPVFADVKLHVSPLHKESFDSSGSSSDSSVTSGKPQPLQQEMDIAHAQNQHDAKADLLKSLDLESLQVIADPIEERPEKRISNMPVQPPASHPSPLPRATFATSMLLSESPELYRDSWVSRTPSMYSRFSKAITADKDELTARNSLNLRKLLAARYALTSPGLRDSIATTGGSHDRHIEEDRDDVPPPTLRNPSKIVSRSFQKYF
ncbi:hypothetical protein FRB96_008618 [Tulasnella sp. 330]|nr:hypothetical protein FRB96_008618 [Tulasnella sp. 330]